MTRHLRKDHTVFVLTIHSIGATGPDASVVSHHDTHDAALAEVLAAAGSPDHVRERDQFGGTIGSLNGRVFQASRTWSIR